MDKLEQAVKEMEAAKLNLEMILAQKMIYCYHCRRMVAFKQKGKVIFCKECGREIYSEKNVSAPRPDSKSPEPVRVGT